MYDSGHDLEQLDADTKVSYGAVKAIFPFKPRDTVTRVAFRELRELAPAAGTAIVQQAVEHPDMPPRKGYVRAKVRREYETHRLEADPEKVTFLLRLAETQLDQVRGQARHLAEVFSDPGVHARF